ncbi:MAG: class SAM-dependent methyltransferase [Flavipsychrobacter sp.]|nr:class SAM-dependent methyltransferase [Flavipsychrobacter sp.]
MALKHHIDAKVRYDQQVDNSRSYVLPFIEKTKQIGPGTTVFEVGTAEGGVLLPFIDRGCKCLGVDLEESRVEYAKGCLKKEVAAGKVELVCQNIYDDSFVAKYKNGYDIIILKDVIEHVPEQANFINHLRKFLKPGGQIFFGFPPWYMPFGGHQQLCRTKWASVLPWYHLLPRFMYVGILKLAKEHPLVIKELLEIRDTQITIESFERIVKDLGMKVVNKQHFLINPIYKFKFGLQPRKQLVPITWLPYLRNFVTTCVYYTIE